LPEVRGFRAGEGNYTYGGITSVATWRKTTLVGAIGQWLGRGSDLGVPWSVTGSMQILPRLELNSTYRRVTVDTIYGGPRQSIWGVGFSMRVSGTALKTAAVPEASSINGRVTIRLSLSESKTPPRIGGDFNKWMPIAMEKSEDSWVFTLTAMPGLYTFAFLDEKGDWFVPKGYPGRQKDGFGGYSAVVLVR
jgi:hypothetical protein